MTRGKFPFGTDSHELFPPKQNQLIFVLFCVQKSVASPSRFGFPLVEKHAILNLHQNQKWRRIEAVGCGASNQRRAKAVDPTVTDMDRRTPKNVPSLKIYERI